MDTDQFSMTMIKLRDFVLEEQGEVKQDEVFYFVRNHCFVLTRY